MLSQEEAKDLDEEENYYVKNLDTGEDEEVDEVVNDMSMVMIAEQKDDGGSEERTESKGILSGLFGGRTPSSGAKDAKDAYVFEEKFSPMASAHSRGGDSLRLKPSIPPGARIEFIRISAVGTSHDKRGKPYSVYYMEVRCNVAEPPVWTVYRRYSEFRKTSDQLRSEGLVVPILPRRKMTGTFETDFVRKRKGELEAWVHNLSEQHIRSAGSKDPQTCETYRIFLTEKGNEPPSPLNQIFPEHIADLTGAEAKSSVGQRRPVDDKATSEQLLFGEDDSSVDSTGPKVSLDDFELIRVIGKGSFGKVTLVKKKDDAVMYAMKVLSKDNIVKRKQVEHTKTERRVLGSINHPFIVKLHYAFQTKNKLYFVLDYAAGGELFFHLSRMKKFPEHMARFYAAELALALDALHANGVVYRDLKPENILIDAEGHIKLADFGLAKEGVMDAAEGAHSLCGTPEYLSPEVLDRQGHGTAVDWWNLGMVTFEMLTGLPPWYTTDRQKLFDRIRNAPLKFPYYVSRAAASFISGLLNRNPQQRLGAGGGAEVCSHPFFSTVDFKGMLLRELSPPFDPCKGQETSADTGNFEQEFTSMAISVDSSAGGPGSDGYQSDSSKSSGGDLFQNFTFDENDLSADEKK